MKKTMKIVALLLVVVLAMGMLAACGGNSNSNDQLANNAPANEPANNEPANNTPAEPANNEPAAPAVDPINRGDYGIPGDYTKAKIYFGSYGFGDAEVCCAMNDDETAFYITYEAFDETQILEGTVANGICMVTYDATGFMSGDCQLIYDDGMASDEPWHPLTGEGAAAAGPAAEPIARADFDIPEQYTKCKVFFGSYGFGDAEVYASFNEDESAFFITYEAFDETQVLEGTVANDICMVTYDATGFMSGDCQLIYDDAVASSEPWHRLV